MMEYELLRIAIAVAGTAIGAWYDIFNRKNVPDLFLYVFLGVSLAINIFDPSAFLQHLPVAALIIAALYAFYRLGQLGGADVFILAAIYAALPTLSTPLLAEKEAAGAARMQFVAAFPLSLPSILPILAIAAFLFFLATCIRYVPFIAARIAKGKIRLRSMQIAQCAIIAAAYMFMLFIFMTSPLAQFLSTSYLVFLFVVMFFVYFFILFKDEITTSMIRWKLAKDVEQEDALAVEHLDPKTVQRYRIGRLVTADQLSRMRKLRIRWPVLDLPMFIPFILAALIIYVLFGDPMAYLL